MASTINLIFMITLVCYFAIEMFANIGVIASSYVPGSIFVEDTCYFMWYPYYSSQWRTSSLYGVRVAPLSRTPVIHTSHVSLSGDS